MPQRILMRRTWHKVTVGPRLLRDAERPPVRAG